RDAEADEPHTNRLGGIDAGLPEEKGENALDDLANLAGARGVAKAQDVREPELVAHRQRFDVHGRDLPVRHAEDRAVQRADTSGAQADVVHGSGDLAELDGVPDPDRLVGDDRYAAYHVLERLL